MHPLFACRVAKLGAEEATHPNLHQHQQQNSPPHPPWAPPGPNTTHQNLQEVRCGGEWVWTHMSVVKPQGMCGGQAGETGYASHGPPSQSAQACAVLLLLLCGCLGWYFVCACVRAGMYTHRVGAHMYTYSTHTHFSTRHKRARYVRIYAYRYLTHTHTHGTLQFTHCVGVFAHTVHTYTRRHKAREAPAACHAGTPRMQTTVPRPHVLRNPSAGPSFPAPTAATSRAWCVRTWGCACMHVPVRGFECVPVRAHASACRRCRAWVNSH